MANGGIGTSRFQPCHNGSASSDHREPQLDTFADRADMDSKVILQSHRQTRFAGSDRRPMCSPSEYFCLKTCRNDAVLDDQSSGAAAATVNGYCLNNGSSPAVKTNDLRSHRNPADNTGVSNVHSGGTPRRSGIPVSGSSLLSLVEICIYGAVKFLSDEWSDRSKLSA